MNASQLARLCEQLTVHEAAFRKYVVYILVEYVRSVVRHTLPVGLRRIVVPGIYCMLGMCSKYELQQMHVALDAAGKAVLKSVHSEYEAGHKYDGKM